MNTTGNDIDTTIADVIRLRRQLDRQQGQRQQLTTDLLLIRKDASNLRRRLRQTEAARAVLQEVARLTQQELEYQLSDLVTAALEAVFTDQPYRFELEFVEKRGRTEAQLWFNREGQRINPIDAAGGGAVDIAAFALRVAMWCLTRPRPRSVLLIDEPFRFLSEDLLPQAALLLRELSKRLGLQIIMVTHSDQLIEEADQIFRIQLRKGISNTTTEEEE